MLYARLIASIARAEDLRPFHRSAVARVIDRSGRMIADSERLSTHMQAIVDLLEEADHWAGEAGADLVTDAHIQQAIDAQVYRSDRMRERMQEQILRDTIMIDTAGEAVGQINGLAVLGLGSFGFGKASRITATVRMGRGEVVNIEREVALSGPNGRSLWAPAWFSNNHMAVWTAIAPPRQSFTPCFPRLHGCPSNNLWPSPAR